MSVTLSAEQEHLITLAEQGKNVLVDACIGSGKTTTIQELCNRLNGKKILYMTYNRLLKLDAKEKIHNSYTTVTNYHGYASMCLRNSGVSCGVSELIQVFNQVRPVNHYDVLILDEYQDIEKEIAEMLEIIKDQNPDIQIIAVGDMEQKIYDKTTLDVKEFITGYLGEYEQAYFTKCFRINKEHAELLGRIWNKNINGVNENCIVTEMSFREAMSFLSKQDVSEVLCLGGRTGNMARMLNMLEEDYPDVYNKNTVYASIRKEEWYGDNALTEKLQHSAIFTTYDSSKGLERPICLLFDYTEDYWSVRITQPQVKYDILRNIFCVAASRGKKHIIYVRGKESLCSERTLSTSQESSTTFKHPFNMSDMFDFKYKEDIEECFDLIETKKIETEDHEIIYIDNYDGFIDLSPCIGIYQEASYFTDYNIDKQIDFMNEVKGDRKGITVKEDDTLDQKILKITSYETQQSRYARQVKPPFVSDTQREQIHSRLSTMLNPSEQVQTPCMIIFTDIIGRKYTAKGRTDVIKDDTVYELKFTSELNHSHFLQCACYIAALSRHGIKKGILWNVRNNTAYEVTVPDTDKFLNAVVRTITKGYVRKARDIEFL